MLRHLCPVFRRWTFKEKRDGLPPGFLQQLVDDGVLGVAYGQRMADVDVLLDLIPQDVPIEAVVADRFALAMLADAVSARGYPDPEFVINQWSTSSTAIAAFQVVRVRRADVARDTGPSAGVCVRVAGQR